MPRSAVGRHRWRRRGSRSRAERRWVEIDPSLNVRLHAYDEILLTKRRMSSPGTGAGIAAENCADGQRLFGAGGRVHVTTSG
eukprot:106574-Chlamydomonas_euryale.AAC.3